MEPEERSCRRPDQPTRPVTRQAPPIPRLHHRAEEIVVLGVLSQISVDRDVGAGFDQSGSTEHLIALQMLRKDRVFDRSEERRVHSHGEQRREQQWNAMEQQAAGADNHNGNLCSLYDSDDFRLVVSIGKLTRQGR